MSYTERFSEYAEVLAHVPADSETAEINTGALNMEGFNRAVVLISVGAMVATATFDVDVEQATDAALADLKPIVGKSTTQLTAAGGDGDQVLIIELETSELDVDGGFSFIQVEFTPATAAVEFSALVLGIVPRFKPVSVANVQEVVT